MVAEDSKSGFRLALGAFVAAVTAVYYWLFFFPPRLVGVNDPDRFYHLALSEMISRDGLLRALPQAEDMGWGRYFPDKEFLFHALTGAANWLGGSEGVMLVVPVVGICTLVVLYSSICRIVKPYQAAILVLLVSLLTAGFIFRMTLLRPHILAVMFFCLLLFSILRSRPWLAAVACAGFALSYHAFYVPLLAIVAAAVLPFHSKSISDRVWLWALAGLILGILLNPYFPSNVVMSWTHVEIALGVDVPPDAERGVELRPIGLARFLLAFGFLPLALLVALGVAKVKRLSLRADTAPFWFLLLLTAALSVLGLKSIRATEYAIPAAILLAGYCVRFAGSRWLLPTLMGGLLIAQGYTAWIYYDDIWSESQEGNTAWYFSAISSIPMSAQGKKLFNCQWDSSAYVLYMRPDIRFVDLLDPSFLWKASPEKYLIRQRLIRGEYARPQDALSQVFNADFVLCASPALNLQMLNDSKNFRLLPDSGGNGPVRVFELTGRPTKSR